MKKTVSKHFRFTPDQANRLSDISKTLNMTETDVIQTSLDHITVEDLSVIVARQKDVNLLNMESIAIHKYENYLFSNATKNLNQISKQMNQMLLSNEGLYKNEIDELTQALNDVTIELSKLRIMKEERS